MADRWDQFEKAEPDPMRAGLGRLALSPAKLMDVARAVQAAPGAIADAATDIYGRIKRWENDPSLPSSRGDADIGADAFALGPGMLSPGFARAAGGTMAAELGAAGGKATWTPTLVRKLVELDKQFAGETARGVKTQKIVENFREFYRDHTGTEYPGSDQAIGTMVSRAKTWGGVNEGTGAAEASKPAPDGGTELGVAGGKILQRQDAQKLVRALAQAGKTDQEIANALNERFAPILDEGTEVARRDAMRARQKMQGGGDFELGAMGGRGSSSTGKLSADDVAQIMRENGWENIRVKPAQHEADSSYVVGHPPGNPPRSGMLGAPGDDTPMVRVPEDDHIGRPLRGSEPGSRVDLGTDPNMASGPRRSRIDDRALVNQAGEPYADPEAFRGWVKWRSGGLVSPDKAPRGTYELPPLEAKPTPEAAGPIQDPRQLKLLSGGVPVPPSGQGDEPAGNPGRFARPELAPSSDDRLISMARALRERIGGAADSIEADLSAPGVTTIPKRSPWDQFERAD
jgi:hypothetical protein